MVEGIGANVCELEANFQELMRLLLKRDGYQRRGPQEDDTRLSRVNPIVFQKEKSDQKRKDEFFASKRACQRT